jgi:hypothetical protein
MPDNFIDYSQYRAWWKCPWYWAERYVRGVQREWTGQRDDAMALGSLVHKGIETFNRTRIPLIPNEIVEELGPTPECLASARVMVDGWAQKYGGDRWSVECLEEPLTNGVILAKVDSVWRVGELVSLTSGIEGVGVALEPGLWVQEYKTKDGGIAIGKYMGGWQYNMQASFQLICARAKWGDEVKGILLNVIEKPRIYIPVRTCKGCKQKYEYRSWTRVLMGHECPGCKHVQEIAPLKPGVGEIGQPEYYRFAVGRTEEQLKQAEEEIIATFDSMCAMRNAMKLGNDWLTPDREACYHSIFGPCEFAIPHNWGLDPAKEQGFVVVEDPLKYARGV